MQARKMHQFSASVFLALLMNCKLKRGKNNERGLCEDVCFSFLVPERFFVQREGDLRKALYVFWGFFLLPRKNVHFKSLRLLHSFYIYSQTPKCIVS